MVSSINSAAAAVWLNQSSSAGGLGIGADLLTAWASARAGVGALDPTTLGADPNAPAAPVWTPGYTPGDDILRSRAFSGKEFFDLEAKLYSDLGASGDYRRLFALHTGLSTMQALASGLEDTTLSQALRKQAEAQFARGMSELQQFFGSQTFDDVRLVQGDRVDAAQTTFAMPIASEDYLTGLVHRGGLTDVVAGLDKSARFDIVATSLGGTERRVAIDLSEMGAMPRSLGAVVSFINSKLSAAGAASRLETVDQTPKTNTLVIGGRTIESKYTGPKQYALKVDVRASERVAFEPIDADAALYVLGSTSGGARLIKLEDTDGAVGLPALLLRPGATADPTGAYVSHGWLGPGAPYGAPPAQAFEQRTSALVSLGDNTYEDRLDAAGEAVLKLELADGRTLSVSTSWRTGDQEAWRVLDGEDADVGRLNDLAERLTQLLHEQGVAAGVDVWADGDDAGLSIFTGDLARVSNFTISGRAPALETIDPAGMVGGLRDGVFARRFEAAAVAASSETFTGKQSFTFTTGARAIAVTVDAGEDGMDAAALEAALNQKIRDAGLRASAALVDVGGALTLRVDGLHDLVGVEAALNEETYEAALQAPGTWAAGGLPVASAGQPFGDALRQFSLDGGSPLSAYPGAINLDIVVDTPAGQKTVSVAIGALERAGDPDSGGAWAQQFRDRLNAALNAAGVYVSASADLSSFTAAEAAGHRIAGISINGDALDFSASAPAFMLGGAYSAARSFTSAQAAAGVSEESAALLADPTASLTFATVWGERSFAVSLQPGDPRTLESVALRLNEELAAQGYDLGVAAVALAGGGAGLRIVSGASHSIRGDVSVEMGGVEAAVTLDPIDSLSAADDPVGAARVAERAARGATVSETSGGSATYMAPGVNASGWFPGRAFDVAIGAGMSVATARAVAAGPDGSVYVLADLGGDSATVAIKGVRDVALLKYDSAGKLAFSRILGAAQSASGFAMAVSSDGKVAIGGAVEGGLSGAGAERGGADSFVALYDADGDQEWTVRRGATANDQVNAIAFAPDGSVIVAGETESALGPALALGGSDGYLRAYSAGGAELFTRQFGAGRDDAVTALAVRDDGAGGVEIFTGGVEDNRGVLRSFTYASATGVVAGATRDLGNFHQGALNALIVDGGALYVGGAIGADRLAVGATAHAAVAAQEGFVSRLDADLTSTALDRASYIGSSLDDSVRGLALADGEIYATGVSGGLIGGQGNLSSPSAFVARLSDEGVLAWLRTFASGGGAVTPNGIVAVENSASPLDVLGLPSGIVAAADSTALASRSALRVGDEFSIGADGRRLTTIRVSERDTMSSLASAINRAIGSAGRATILREDGVERLRITASDGRAVRIEAGRADRDALSALGLTTGIIAANTQARGGLKTFGLGLLAADLKLDNAASLAKTKAELSAAISLVKQAYDTLLYPNAKALTEEEKALEARRQAAGQAPEYYTQQLANYQAALARLGG